MNNRKNRAQRKRQWMKRAVINRGGSQPWNQTWKRKCKSGCGARRVGHVPWDSIGRLDKDEYLHLHLHLHFAMVALDSLLM